ncbi:MBL fold metallo-hydrolase [Nakamurella antarctica]|uniref:MBL fold metallo-hydrolase n=1 Tax=Nakamurella antarctica TaxID=1902245 RepID=UPI001EF119DF|nr:MBL fold metallo-hydrolase [Nakamurella antarctica]
MTHQALWRQISRLAATGAATASAIAAASWIVPAVRGVRPALGATSREVRADLAQRSGAVPATGSANTHPSNRKPNGKFRNALPPSEIAEGAKRDAVGDVLTKRSAGRPDRPVPLAHDDFPDAAAPLALTWLGHASAVVEIDGFFVLVDPVWSDRVSPSNTVGPQRLHAAPTPLASLPQVDAIVISHDHYDHLDKATVIALVDQHQAPFIVPLGIGAHLRRWGVPSVVIVELDWNREHVISRSDGAELRVVCTEARHFSGRGLTQDDTLWASWALIGPEHRVFFGGDTGPTPGFSAIGRDYGPFDLALLPIGAYNPLWPDIHLNPEEAVATHLQVMAKVLLPIHWATFNLAFHPWVEPVRRLIAAAEVHEVPLVIPRPGQRVVLPGNDGDGFPPLEPWWEAAVGSD